MNPQGPHNPQQPQEPFAGVPPVAGDWQAAPQQTPVQPLQSPSAQPLAPEYGTAAPGATVEHYGVDYLSQIAPQQQRSINRFAVIALIGGVLISALVAVILMFGAGGPDATQQLTPVSLRIGTLKTVTKEQQLHLKESQISEANAALNSSLATMETDIQSIMQQRKIKVNANSAPSKSEKSYASKLSTTLDNSYQRGTLDQIYTSQMTYELSLLKSNLSKLKRSSKSTEINSFSDSAIKNINTILAAYEKFATSS